MKFLWEFLDNFRGIFSWVQDFFWVINPSVPHTHMKKKKPYLGHSATNGSLIWCRMPRLVFISVPGGKLEWSKKILLVNFCSNFWSRIRIDDYNGPFERSPYTALFYYFPHLTLIFNSRKGLLWPVWGIGVKRFSGLLKAMKMKVDHHKRSFKSVSR